VLAWQGIACLDVNDDATRIALGTIAPAGDPNVVLLDADGRLLRQQRAGQRWINQVALGGDDVLRAVCTMPAGRAGDMPEVFRRAADAVASEQIAWRRGRYTVAGRKATTPSPPTPLPRVRGRGENAGSPPATV
jgi:hypothetical protein